MDGNGFRVGNLDCVVIAEEPKIGKYRDKMVERIAGILGLEPGAVSIKGKTAESLGEIGSGNAIEAHAAVLLLEK